MQHTKHFTKWHLPHGAKIRLGKGGVNNLQYSPDGSHIAIDSRIGIWLYDTYNNEVIALLDTVQYIGATKLPYSWTGKTLYHINRHQPSIIALWNTSFGRRRITLEGPIDDFIEIVLSPDGRTFASVGSEEETIRLWDSQTGKIISSVIGHSKAISTIAFSPDSKMLATAGYDNSIQLCDVNGLGKFSTLNGYEEDIIYLVFSPNCMVLVCSGYDGTHCLWDITTGEKIATLLQNLKYSGPTVFSPDGTLIATNMDDHSIKIWNADTGNEHLTLFGHQDILNDMEFSPDGKRLQVHVLMVPFDSGIHTMALKKV